MCEWKHFYESEEKEFATQTFKEAEVELPTTFTL